MTGPELRALRDAANVARRTLAAAAGVHMASLKTFESGERVKPSTAYRIIQASAGLRHMPKREHATSFSAGGKYSKIHGVKCCKYHGCGARLNKDNKSGYCREHWREVMSPGHRAKRGAHEPTIQAVAVADWTQAVRVSAEDARRLFGIMPKCRHCAYPCKHARVPRGSVCLCPASPPEVRTFYEHQLGAM